MTANKLTILKSIDDVRIFPSINIPAPIFIDTPKQVILKGIKTTKSSELKHNLNKLRTIKSTEVDGQKLYRNQKPLISLKGIVKTSRSELLDMHPADMTNQPAFVGFNAASFFLDGGGERVKAFENTGKSIANQRAPSLSTTNLNDQALNEFSLTSQVHGSATLAELRNYSSLMDQFSHHNFLIWNGKVLRNTPEFQSFRRTYDTDWGPISSLMATLENLMTTYDVKLAIINGQKAADLALCGNPYLHQEEVLSCVSNIEQIRPLLTSFTHDGYSDKLRAVIKIQSVSRQYLAKKKYRHLQRVASSAVTIQSIARMFLQRCKVPTLMSLFHEKMKDKFRMNRDRINAAWRVLDRNVENQKILLIYIPSFSGIEAMRLNVDNYAATQNAHLTCMHQLDNPNIHILYISPLLVGVPEQLYHDKFLQLLGISTLPKRLRFIVPEVAKRLPDHVPLPQMLWYCSATLRKIQSIIRGYSNTMIIPGAVTWVEKRISNFLNVPLLGPEPEVAEKLYSKSVCKQLFVDSNVNFGIGAHDLTSEEDLIICLSKLMASNLEVDRWLLRLNCDEANETLAVIQSVKVSVVPALRAEQAAMVEKNKSAQIWFSKYVQASARKRLVAALQQEISSVGRVCRRDIFESWSTYMHFLSVHGATIEAEPPEVLGHVDAMCLITPEGEVHQLQGVECLLGEDYQRMGAVYPQTCTPPPALQGAVQAVATKLFESQSVIGFLTVSFVSFWDAYDGIPRLWGQGVSFGCTALMGGVGTLGVALKDRTLPNPVPATLVSTLLVEPSAGSNRVAIYIPVAAHSPLRSSRDDVFFHMCRLNGVSYDPKERLGTLFILVDGIVGGVLSVLCIGSSRSRALEIATNTLSFVSNSFGRNQFEGHRPWNDLNAILLRVRWLGRKERAKGKLSLRRVTAASAGNSSVATENLGRTVNSGKKINAFKK